VLRTCLLVGLCACKACSHLYTAMPLMPPHGGMPALSPTLQDVRFAFKPRAAPRAAVLTFFITSLFAPQDVRFQAKSGRLLNRGKLNERGAITCYCRQCNGKVRP